MTAVTVIAVSATIVTLISGILIPVAVSIVTKADAPDWLKQALTALLAGAASVLSASLTDTGAAIVSSETVTAALLTWLTAVAAYHGVYKSHNLNDVAVPEFGIG